MNTNGKTLVYKGNKEEVSLNNNSVIKAYVATCEDLHQTVKTDEVVEINLNDIDYIVTEKYFGANESIRKLEVDDIYLKINFISEFLFNKIEKIIFTDGVDLISANFVSGSFPNLTKVTIPSSVTYIDYFTFRDDTKVTLVFKGRTEQEVTTLFGPVDGFARGVKEIIYD